MVTRIGFNAAMDGSSAAQYPGHLATSAELLRLAKQYRAASHAIQKLGRAGDPVSFAPFRLNAIHAIELYLSALLLHVGYEPSRLRGLQHDLGLRADLASECGLKLRFRTRAHLQTLANTREYLITRYAPEAASMLSQVNRLAATLEEVAKKVEAMSTAPIGPRIAKGPLQRGASNRS